MRYMKGIVKRKGEREGVREGRKVFGERMEEGMRKIGGSGRGVEKMWREIKKW